MQLRHLVNRLAPARSMETPENAALVQNMPLEPALAGITIPQRETAGPDARIVTASIGDLIYEWRLATDKLSWGPNLEAVLGPIAMSDLSTGLAYGERLSAESATSRYEEIVNSDEVDEGAGVPYRVIYSLVPPREAESAAAIWVEDTGRWFKGDDGRPAFAHGVLRVITERHENERRLSLNSQFDPLTGVLNRNHLCEHVQRFLAEAERSHRPFAVMLVALENLFSLNRTYGYDAGDEVIVGLAKRLKSNIRSVDIVARYAGNKFALVLRDCDSDQSRVAAMRVLDSIVASPFETAAGDIPATIRIGGVVAPREGRTAQVLFQHAEEALDVARARNGSRFVAYTRFLAREDARLRALRVADSIVSALNERRVELAFQPIVHADTGEIAFQEALLRVRLVDGSVVVPGDILPVAEKAGLVRLLDQRVLELAMDCLYGDPDLRISVNASLATFLDPEWPDRLAHAVGARPDIAERLIVEITETSMIEDIETTRHVIARCKSLGVKVAMDDFGSGHTSFRNLRELAFDLVKIDGAFIQNIVNSADDRFFVRTLIDLAHHLSLKTVAEWVQDEETAILLREWGVDFFQGSLFGRAEIGTCA